MHHPTAALEAEVTTLKLRITTLEYELAKCRKDATYEHSKAGRLNNENMRLKAAQKDEAGKVAKIASDAMWHKEAAILALGSQSAPGSRSGASAAPTTPSRTRRRTWWACWRALLKAVELSAETTHLRLEVHSTNDESIAWYNYMGFEEWGEAEEGALMLTMERRGAA